MGVPAGVPKGPRRPSHVAYYVAMVGILTLLIMLCLYFFYYFIKKIKELSSADLTPLPTTSCRPPPAATAYPVQPVVRDSASAMAKLCKQVPAVKGDTVFPTSTSPAALRASTGDGDHRPEEHSTEATDELRPGDTRPGDVSLSDTRPDIDTRPDKAPPVTVPVITINAGLDVPAR